MNGFTSLARVHRCTGARAFALLALAALATVAASAQAAFTAGNLVVSRSVYAGSAGSVTIGETLPPNCVANKANKVTCGTAALNGTFPEVFNNVNSAVDGSFGITSPIFLDELTPSGSLVNTLEVPNSLTTTGDQRVFSGDPYALGQLTGLGIGAWLTGGGLKTGTMEAGLEETAEIGGRAPINAKYAGGVHPSGIGFTSQGYPNFSSFADYQVEVKGLTGNYATDAGMANRAAGLKSTPKNYVWHHVEDGRTMQLIPRSVHRAVAHTGGASIIKNGVAVKK